MPAIILLCSNQANECLKISIKNVCVITEKGVTAEEEVDIEETEVEEEDTAEEPIEMRRENSSETMAINNPLQDVADTDTEGAAGIVETEMIAEDMRVNRLTEEMVAGEEKEETESTVEGNAADTLTTKFMTSN
ncbi:unnamed protein product [Caenorhabditis sp. 36 PRJEB53466]|nr:unnamed protein product [Caenorhabditis sp. 36 PRJEB53466]